MQLGPDPSPLPAPGAAASPPRATWLSGRRRCAAASAPPQRGKTPCTCQRTQPVRSVRSVRTAPSAVGTVAATTRPVAGLYRGMARPLVPVSRGQAAGAGLAAALPAEGKPHVPISRPSRRPDRGGTPCACQGASHVGAAGTRPSRCWRVLALLAFPLAWLRHPRQGEAPVAVPAAAMRVGRRAEWRDTPGSRPRYPALRRTGKRNEPHVPVSAGGTSSGTRKDSMYLSAPLAP